MSNTDDGTLRKAIQAIQNDCTIDPSTKARKMQVLIYGLALYSQFLGTSLGKLETE